MENKIERNCFRSVPQFGGWESQDPAASSYTIMFTRARAEREHLKRDILLSLGNEQELLASMQPEQIRTQPERYSVLVWRLLNIRKIIAYVCYMKKHRIVRYP